jgi:hypothetical protein
MKKNIFRLALVAAFASVIIPCKKNDSNPTDVFPGTWHVTSHHSPSGQTLHWDLTIVAGSSDNEILLDNFDQIGATHYIRATYSGSSFTIPQQLYAGNNTTYQGSGTYNSNGTLSFSYTADDGVQVDNVTATATK